jgi:nicotinamidase-related amidase
MKINLDLKTNFEELLNIEKEIFKVNNKSALFIIDINNGFVKEGILSSPRVKDIVPNIIGSIKCFTQIGAPIIAFTDCHAKDSVEFNYFPEHCLENNIESQLVDELKVYESNMTIVKKSSTNAFLEEETQKIISELLINDYENWIIIGCITDVCVKQFALTLRAYFNKINKRVNVIVPIDSIETYDAPNHNANAMNLYSLSDMKANGIILVNNVE